MADGNAHEQRAFTATGVSILLRDVFSCQPRGHFTQKMGSEGHSTHLPCMSMPTRTQRDGSLENIAGMQAAVACIFRVRPPRCVSGVLGASVFGDVDHGVVHRLDVFSGIRPDSGCICGQRVRRSSW